MHCPPQKEPDSALTHNGVIDNKVKKRHFALQYEEQDDIHNYAAGVASCKNRLAKLEQGDLGIRFIEKLKLAGLSDGRIAFYGDRVITLLKLFEKMNVNVIDAQKKDCESVLADILSHNYKGESKRAFALVLLRLVHFAKTGEIGDRDSGYVEEVSWIRPSRYEDKGEIIRAEDLLTVEEVSALIDKTTNKRDRAMFWVMFEGAFRPGELLHLRVGGVEFRDNYLLLSTHGKTGNKRVALVVSFKPLLEWLAEHPLRDDPKAPLWYSFSSMSKTKAVTYGYLREHLKRCKEKAGIKKRVWNYLFRHSQLTLLAKKLSDQTLCVYGNWKPGSDMPARYVHLSGKDAENAILQLHGIKNDDGQSSVATLKVCPRCGEQNTPEIKRCLRCGFILDETLLAEVSRQEQTEIASIVSRLERLESLGEKMDRIIESLLEKRN